MKKGITVTTMTVVVLVMIILATTITVTINSSIKYSNLSVWANEISTIQDVVYETTLKKSAADFLLDEVEFNTLGISQDILNEQFKGETITNNKVTFNEIDLGKLEIANTIYGNKENETDIYVYSTTTQKVYYIAGIQEKYYTLTEELSNRFNIQSVDTKSSVISFVPSIQGFTNKPISVVVKVPSEFSNVNVTTSATGMTVTNTGTVDNRACYKVNSENLTGNYNITVSYNNGQETLVATYMVNGYDTTKPVIEDITDDNLVYKQNETVKKISIQDIKVSDTESGVDKVWYIKGTIPTTTKNVLEYFKLNGTKIRKNKFNIESLDGTYTICAVDRAGNYTYGTCEITGNSNGWIQTSDRTVVKGKTVLNIGDTINYKSNVSGYNDTNGWKVLGAENGELLIMSATDITSKTFNSGGTLEGAKQAYENAVAELNELCVPYGKGAYAIGARSITVEDVDRVTGYDKTTYETGTISEYGIGLTYKYNGTNKPAYEYSNGVSGTASTKHDNGFHWYDEEKGWQSVSVSDLTNTENNGKEITKLTNTYYYYDVDKKTDLAKGTDAYNMLFGSSDENEYWLASLRVATRRTASDFGLRRVSGGSVTVYTFVDTSGWKSPRENSVRAVVRLSPMTECSGSSEAGWNLSSSGWTQTSDRKVKKGDTVINIGDTINYDETKGGTITGLTNVDWKVLGAENGELLIMSTSDVTSKTFNSGNTLEGGKQAYENAVAELNELCVPYGKGAYALGARSITVEDVDRVTGFDKTTYETGTISEYGNVVTYKYNGTNTPAYVGLNGVNGTVSIGHYNGFHWYDVAKGWQSVYESDLKRKENNGKEIGKVTNGYYVYDVDQKTDLAKGTDAYSMLFGYDNTEYWLASICGSGSDGGAGYGIHRVFWGGVNFQSLVASVGWLGYLKVTECGVRAVVKLSPNVMLSGSSANGWNMTGNMGTNKVNWKVLS